MTWRALEFCNLMDRAYNWATLHLRPWISAQLDLCRSKPKCDLRAAYEHESRMARDARKGLERRLAEAEIEAKLFREVAKIVLKHDHGTPNNIRNWIANLGSLIFLPSYIYRVLSNMSAKGTSLSMTPNSARDLSPLQGLSRQTTPTDSAVDSRKSSLSPEVEPGPSRRSKRQALNGGTPTKPAPGP